VHVVATLKKHLQNLKIKINVNVTSANHQKSHAKRSAKREVGVLIKITSYLFFIEMR